MILFFKINIFGFLFSKILREFFKRISYLYKYLIPLELVRVGFLFLKRENFGLVRLKIGGSFLWWLMSKRQHYPLSFPQNKDGADRTVAAHEALIVHSLLVCFSLKWHRNWLKYPSTLFFGNQPHSPWLLTALHAPATRE